MKASDIPEIEILRICNARRTNPSLLTPDEALEHKYPSKVIMAKMEKMLKKELLEYGVSLRTAWLTEKGLRELTILNSKYKEAKFDALL